MIGAGGIIVFCSVVGFFAFLAFFVESSVKCQELEKEFKEAELKNISWGMVTRFAGWYAWQWVTVIGISISIPSILIGLHLVS